MSVWKPIFFVIFLFGSLSLANAIPEDNRNFRFSPMVVLTGGLTVSMDFKINEKWTFGPELSLTSFKLTSTSGPSEDTSIHTYSIAARGNWFHNGVFNDGFYIGPFVSFASAKARLEDVNSPVTKEKTAFFGGAVGGYAWFWKSFNAMLGGGVTVPFGTAKVEVENSRGARTDAYINGAGVAILEISLGWTF